MNPHIRSDIRNVIRFLILNLIHILNTVLLLTLYLQSLLCFNGEKIAEEYVRGASGEKRKELTLRFSSMKRLKIFPK